MATKRQLKKAIKRTCGYLAGECIISQQFIPGIDKEKLDDAIFEVADLQYDRSEERRVGKECRL